MYGCWRKGINNALAICNREVLHKNLKFTVPILNRCAVITSIRQYSNSKPFIEIKVDRSELGSGYDSIKNNELSDDEILKYKEPITPLGKELKSYIKNRGPLSINEFMTQALTHNVYGYYQNKLNAQKIGSSGDFITSPEMSSLFSEMVTIWCVGVWESMNKPSRLNLIELGPGNGTLMNDILEISRKNFPSFHQAIQVCMVEMSNEMHRKQCELLECKDVIAKDHCLISVTKHGNRVGWYKQLFQVYEDKDNSGYPMLAIGHEFLDAFPVYQFIHTASGRWDIYVF